MDRFDLRDDDKFTVFSQCLFGVGSAYWEEVLSEIDGRTDEDFVHALTLYVEKVAGVQNLQDSILQWISKWKKLCVFTLKEYVRSCNELYVYASGPYIRGGMEIPTEALKKETFFFTMCKSHQEDFAQQYQDVNDVTSPQMITYFEGCFRKDTSSGKTAQIMAAHEENCRKANAKRRNGNCNPPQGQGRGRNSQRRRRDDDRRRYDDQRNA